MTDELLESAKACVKHEGHCYNCKWEKMRCWGSLMKWEAAKLIVEAYHERD